MSNFDKKMFGQNLKKYRKMQGLSQENIAMLLGKTKSTICKYENGELLMTAEDISKVCNELKIYSSDLFEQDYKVLNEDNINNPFKTNKLYMYFNAYDYRTKKFSKNKYILLIKERADFVRVDFYNPRDEKVYLRGFMQADKIAAFISFENYEPNNARLERSIIEINIVSGVDGLMLGAYFGTNSEYTPSIRKCYFSKKDIEFTDEMLENLKPTEHDLVKLSQTGAMYLDIFNN